MSDLINVLRHHSPHSVTKTEMRQAADLIEQLQQRMEELEKERDMDKFIIERMKDAASIIETERDALAAHVERVNKSLLWFIEIIETDFMPDLEDYAELQEEISDAKNLVSQSPQTSLAEIGIGIEMAAEEHAHKIRNRGDGD